MMDKEIVLHIQSIPRRLVRLANGYVGWGKTGKRQADLHCSECGGAGFSYHNGAHWSEDGVRGYRCMKCGTIKPESIDGDPVTRSKVLREVES